MFPFWTTESRGSDKALTLDAKSHPTLLDRGEPSVSTVSALPTASGLPTPISPAPTHSLKRRRPSAVDTASHVNGHSSSKRIKTEQDGGLPSPASAYADGDEAARSSTPAASGPNLERAKDVIQYQFGLEILMKHDELRLINQELAKCQIALEQLRRCHLIPYPVQCPTPSQMLDISSGEGPALQSKPGESVPKWAPPFGVVDGPYARHYAKWLIPDPMFDGIQPEPVVETARARNAVAEGRTTRNSMSDAGGLGKQRSARGQGTQKLQALSSGYSHPKDKSLPCIVKRSDGLTVKLVCIDCERWNFSSTQGFINHCRIAHRRDYKSHDEAALHCGQPIDVDENGGIAPEEKKPSSAIAPIAPATTSSALVHPLARSEPLSEQQAYKALLSRINASLELYHAGQLPDVKKIPTAPSASNSASPKSQGFVGSSETPFLSKLMQKKKLGGNLHDKVKDAKTKVDWDAVLSRNDSEDTDQSNAAEGATSSKKAAASTARTSTVMRKPASSTISPPPFSRISTSPVPLPATSRGRAPAHLVSLPITATRQSNPPDLPETPLYEDDMDTELSPNTVASNNAPSLVSDDGEYDDSDDGSSSDTSDEAETRSVPDVAEINIEEEVHDVVVAPSAPICQHRKETTTDRTGTGKFKKDESRHVTFVTPIPPPKPKTKAKTTASGGNRRKQKS
ncbi:hypothetical protein SMACR_06312 [Sordaria macrospora]|uniref:WGS project CABT00000000 data, contig 2.34 n=2 Tax=Sordaria macrospora TaxID=5147 RepID=F7W6F5_SORMK|nr:uncharacterized protein SMAC_06312 [Sordaria macrospora k-hell]KAA8635202.1 hypothetical protein SMACR_06312 [Sordaria macrospora]KAH7630415.1 hypothetical protein B0T09DRAFT_264848 [Sordaria sp. MPI-SDFR-AT-0083]WPJ67082.1 hypothetical protein SMAC4_06312 [Sordaria macrospora]CCC13094.1 unnamed protein product [Sordaria macrospora k-hell]